MEQESTPKEGTIARNRYRRQWHGWEADHGVRARKSLELAMIDAVLL
jgi:hypothetical protein